MSIKTTVGLLWATQRKKTLANEALQAISHQAKLRQSLVQEATHTAFGKQHRFEQITTSKEFADAVPLATYEQIKPYIERILAGEKNVLWKGLPLYFSKTSGTTSGVKYIPITKDSLPNHIETARDALLCYIADKKNADLLKGKMIFLSGSPRMDTSQGIPSGRLSGIVHNHIPSYLLKNRLPSLATNCIEGWEEKLRHIVQETQATDLRLLSGIPPWVQMYLDALELHTGKRIATLFPQLSLFVHGGVNVQPYLQRLRASLGTSVDFLETFPASEGFIAYQDTLDETAGMRLNTHSGIYFEFIPIEEYHHPHPRRLSLEEVELHKSYALVLSNNAGLWGYSIGDIVSFVSLHPYRIIVKGRTQQFISAFGEHVIAEEVESALVSVSQRLHTAVREFTVAPYMDTAQSTLSRHVWYMEFETPPSSLDAMEHELDEALRRKNVYYDDLRRGNIIAPLRIVPVKEGSFLNYMRATGKLGEQHKVVHLSNDRKIIDHPAFQNT